MKKFVNFIPAIIIFCIIFYFSSMTGEQSDKISNPIAFNFYSFLGVNTLHFFVLFVRKTAHVVEYIVLFLAILYGFDSTFDFKLSIDCLYSLVVTYLCSIIDEFHQAFIPGRAGAFLDTLIDISGVLVIVLLFLLVNLIKKNSPKKGK